MSAPQRSIGLDFGTTNSALAVATSTGAVLARFPVEAATGSSAHDTETFRSILFFDPHDRDKRGRPKAITGPSAIARYVVGDGSGRLIQSLKSQLASRLFVSTMIAGRPYTLEELIACILQGIRAGAEATIGPLGNRIVVGRPVRYTHAETPDDDEFALGRMRAALALCGFDDVVFEYEPVAAAYHYERDLDHDELVMIADFGGGTSDFCLVQVGPRARRGGVRPILGTEGVALAGDAFDSELVRRVVAPHLGYNSHYRLPMDRENKTIAIPPWIYQKLRRWHHLSFLKSKETLQFLGELRKQALEPKKIESLIHLVEADLGFHLYKAIEGTKVALSSTDTAQLRFDDEPIAIDTGVARTAFEEWIGDSLRQIEECIDRLLAKTGVPASSVDRVFMTGGSSLVPAVRRIFATRFGDERLRAGDELTSVALGLALRARDG